MKTLKKALAIILCLLMVMSMAVAAVAAGAASDHTISINNATEGYTYAAYQIFKGDFNNDATILSNIVWGDGIDGDTFLIALNADTKNQFSSAFATATSAADVAKALTAFQDDSAALIAFAELATGHLTTATATTSTLVTAQGDTPGHYELSVPDGYYLVKNTSISADNTADNSNAYTSVILQVVGADKTVNHKAKAPTLDKEIKNDMGQWTNVDDSQIGDKVEFLITTTVPDTRGYDKYTYIIHDKLSDGLTFDGKNTVNLYKDKDMTQQITSTYYTVYTKEQDENQLIAHGEGSEKCTFVVHVKILELVKDGVLSAGASIYTHYTATLNDKAAVYNDSNTNTARLEYSNNPTDDNSKSFTPDDKVYEWTYQLGVKKVDGSNENTKLGGAVFVLSKLSDLTLTAGENGVPTDTSNLIPVKKTTAEGGAVSYTITKEAGDSTTYLIEGGEAAIKGLDVGTYYLYEIKAPDGYNKLTEPVKIEIKPTYSEDGSTVNTLEIDVDNKKITGDTVEIANKKGSSLPETGGIGTTIFYVVGGAMMFVAVVLLVTKKKMSKK